MYQINEEYLLVGTEFGKLELWNIETNEFKKDFEAHAGSQYGITAILAL